MRTAMSARGVEAEAGEGECEGGFDDAGAAGWEGAAGEDVAAGVGEDEYGDVEVGVDELEGGPEAEDVAGPVEAVADDAESVFARAGEEFADHGGPCD